MEDQLYSLFYTISYKGLGCEDFGIHGGGGGPSQILRADYS